LPPGELRFEGGYGGLQGSHRERVLWEIAESYGDLVDPSFGPSGVRGSGELGLRMPWSYTGTVREFERLVGVLRGAEPVLRWHLLEYHLKAVRVVRFEVVRVQKGRRLVELRHPDGSLVMRRQVDFRRHPAAVKGQAEAAVRWLAAMWGAPFEPEIPVHPEELRERRAAARRAELEERRRRDEELLVAV
jgi:hypothetical protein